MTYEQRPGGYPASPDIDMGLPEVCERCDRDCSEPCEAFKRLEAIKKFYDEMYHDYMNSRTTPLVSNYISKFREVLEADVKCL